MRINFDNPWLLLAFIPAAALVILPFILSSRRRRAGGRKITALIIRLVAVALLVSSLAGLSISKYSDRNSVMIVADLSDSTRPVADKFTEYMKIAASYADDRTKVGLLTFGYKSEYELPLSDKIRFSDFETKPAGNYTDIYSAIIKAAAMLPESTNNRIVLLTDGKENVNSVKNAATILSTRGIRLDAIILETGAVDKEIQLSDIRVPDVLYEGEEFTISVIIESNSDCSATLVLEEDGVSVSSSDIKLTKGTNRFVFNRKAEATGINSYSVRIKSDSDRIIGNNSIYSFINVLGTPKILIIDGSGSESHEIEKLLAGSVKFDTVLPASAPPTIAELRRYSAVIMMNTKKSDLPEGYDELLDSYVKQLGRGLLYTGGTQSYILGSWKDTKLEELLPVNLTVQEEYELNDVGMMLLIDNSGSMGYGAGSALELAKEGAIKAADAAKDIDKVGAIAFSDNAVWMSAMVPGTQKQSVKNKIAAIPAGGGTMFCGSLEESYKALKDSGCRVKSIILLTDGYPGDDFEIRNSGIVKKLKDEGITVTSIAVGFEASPEILEFISGETGGNVTMVKNEADLPNIIYQEAVKALNGSYVCNDPFMPTVGDYTSLLTGVSALPQMQGYVLTEAKSLSYTVLKASNDKPLLSEWQYGLGKVISFTSDLNGKWSSGLLASEDGRTMIRNMVSAILPTVDTEGGGSLTVSRSGDKGIVSLRTEDAGTQYKTEAAIISPSGKQSTVTMTPDGINGYTGSFYIEEEGSYVCVVTQQDENGNTVLSKENAMAVKYSDEYDMFSKDYGYVAECCAATGGSAKWTDMKSILDVKIKGAGDRRDLGTLFLILAIVLIMLDIALRRLGINFAEIIEKLRKKKAAPEPEVNVPEGAPASAKKPEEKEGKEKTETFKAKKDKKQKPPKPDKKKKSADDADDAMSGINALIKDIDNSRRHKM